MNELIFTKAGVLDLLLQIDELKDKSISLTDSMSGDLQLEIDDSVYLISQSSAEDVQVDTEVIDDIADYNMYTYEQLEESDEVSLSQPVESGIIKEIAKTLAVGGLVRLTGHLLKGKK